MFSNICICALLLYGIVAFLLYTIFVGSNVNKKALPFIRIYTYFFYLNDKPYWVSEKNNTAFFKKSKDTYVP